MFTHRRISILFAVVYACVLFILAAWALHFKFDGSPSYGRCAFRFLENGFFENAYRPPLYPSFLAFMISVFGEGWERWAILFQICLGALTCGVTVYLASHAGGHWFVGIIAGCLWMINLPLHLEMIKQRETCLYIALQMLAILFFMESKGWMRAMLVGLTVALAHLTRPDCVVPTVMLFGLLLPPAVFENRRSENLGSPGCNGVFSIIRRSCNISSLAQFLLAVIVFCLGVAPWQHSINRMTGKFNIGSSALLGVNLSKGNNPYLWQFYPSMEIDNIQSVLREESGISPSVSTEDFELNAIHLKVATDYIKADLPGFFGRTVIKSFLFFSPIPIPYSTGEIVKSANGIEITSRKLVNPVFMVLYTCVSLIIFLGAFLFFKAWCKLTLYARAISVIFLFNLILNVGLHAILFYEYRYRFPLEPLLVILSAVAFFNLSKKYINNKILN